MAEPICFRAGGVRTVVMKEEEVRGILERFEAELEASTAANADARYKLDLSCRAWPRPTLEILRPFIERILERVVVLKIDDIIASLLTEQGLDSLAFFADVFAGAGNRVEELDLTDNALGIRAIEILRPLLAGPEIRALRLNNGGLSLAVCEVLADTLRPVAGRLTELDLSRNQIGPEGARFVGRLLSGCARLQRFTYAGSRPLSEGTVHLCRGLAAACDLGSDLRLLDLNDCNATTEEAVEELCRLLQNSPGLETLNLRDCSLGEEGIQAVLTALEASGCNLRDFYLGGNEMGEDEGAQAFVGYLEALSARGDDCRLSLLDLEGSELGDAGTVQVVQALTSGGLSDRLHHLNLDMNEITAPGARSLLTNAFGAQVETISLKDNMDIPSQLAARLHQVYGEGKVLVDDDLDEDDDYEEEKEEEEGQNAGVDELQAALEGAHL